MLFRVSGKFADRHTFSMPLIDGTDAKDALAQVTSDPAVRDYGSPVVSITVKALGAGKKKIRISDKPSAERKPKSATKTATQAPTKRK